HRAPLRRPAGRRAGVLLTHHLRRVRRALREGPAVLPDRRPGRARRPACPGADGGREHRPLRWVPCTRRPCFSASRADQLPDRAATPPCEGCFHVLEQVSTGSTNDRLDQRTARPTNGSTKRTARPTNEGWIDE